MNTVHVPGRLELVDTGDLLNELRRRTTFGVYAAFKPAREGDRYEMDLYFLPAQDMKGSDIIDLALKLCNRVTQRCLDLEDASAEGDDEQE